MTYDARCNTCGYEFGLGVGGTKFNDGLRCDTCGELIMAIAQFRSLLVAGAAAILVSACGADEIASPGTGGNITINNGTTSGGTSGGTTTGGTTGTLVTPAGGCPTIADPQGLTDAGTITGPTGTWRVCSLPARINASINLPKIAGLLYQLPGRVDVGTDLGAVTAAGAPAAVTLTTSTAPSPLKIPGSCRIAACKSAAPPISPAAPSTRPG